jgi:hypothetical protein
VLPLVVAGFLNKQSAAMLGITEVTLQIHRRQIMHKMAAASFADLVRMCGPLGIPDATQNSTMHIAGVQPIAASPRRSDSVE